MEPVPDLAGYVAYCENCHEDREFHLFTANDAKTGEEYFEYICSTCFSILLTFARAKSLSISTDLP